MTSRTWRGLAAWTRVAVFSTLAACGGGNDDGEAELRFLNATVDIGSLSMYTGDDRRAADTPPDSLSSYSSLKAGNQDIKFKRSGSDSALLSNVNNLSKDTKYTVVAWGREGSARLAIMQDDEAEPSSGLVKVRVFNAATDAGTVDVYIGDASTDFSSVSASVSSVAVGSYSGFTERSAGALRIRVTTAGNRDEWRLDIPEMASQSKQVITLILQPSPGGVLVHALSLVQQGSVSPQKNQQARARVVSSVTGNGVVAAKVGTTSLAAASTSPSIGSYVLVPAGTRTLLAQVGGNTVLSESMGFTAGQDYTVLVYGTPAVALVNRVTDDNRAAGSSRAKVRLVHGVDGHDTLTLTVDAVSVANDLAYGTVSSFGSVSSNTGNAVLEVTSPLATSALYTTTRSSSSTTGVSLESTGVYTLFMLSGSAAPRGFLRRDR